ncbi:AAA family ATPase [Paenibacillus sp. MSJ-34]|uniref:AAA family ATPase n=1 Tax=Paenibacillus sp. MSJ-34 TaxID=2841529 RepID=UPI001C11574E|nr:AAA family ATPase [Paenibacillus sp. MSJ-34]MBU5441512.1 AAA family ATPase [Paenibacillus sp. MSJ-34]
MNVAFDGVTAAAAIPGRKMRLLLAYLALAYDIPQGRKKNAFDFWPDSTEKQALSNLRKLLHDLRECLPQLDRYLIATPTYIQWNKELSFYSDVREFEQAAQGHTLYELRKAEELYKGELLPGFYEEWLEAKRGQLAQMYGNVLAKLIPILESRREYVSAIVLADKLLIHNKLKEETYRILMRLYALNQDRAGVMKTYRELCNVLQTELGVEPAEETMNLLERLMRNDGNRSDAAYKPTPLIGRIDEWERLVGAWKGATAQGSVLLLMKGEAGIGKTRLAQEFKANMERRGGRTAFAGCFPSIRSLSYVPVAAWLRSFPMTQLAPAVLSELARLLPELYERHPDLPMPNPIKENWQLNRWYEAIERALQDKQPLLLILDDLQWSDAETLQLLSYLLRSDSGTKLLVIATMRTDESPGQAVEHFLAGLRIERKLTEIELAPLNEEDTKRLIAETVGEDPADRHGPVIYAQTGGNPLFIAEMLSEWQAVGGKSEFRLSSTARTVIENRLARLSPDQRRLASAIAAVGRPVSAALLPLLTDMEEDAILDSIDRLTQMKILQEAAGGLYEFTHDILRENVYRADEKNRRRIRHRQIASGLLEFHQGKTEAVAAEIAFHYELAGMQEEAVVYYEMAASAAEKIYANETRIKYYRKLRTLLPTDRILPVLMKLGDALIIAGNWSEAETTYRQWLERSDHSVSIRERSLCDVALGNCLRLQAKYEEAKFYLERALRCFELIDDHSGLSSVYVTLGILDYYLGNYDKVLDYQVKRAELPPVANRSQEDCRFFGIIGHVFYDQCEYEQAIHWIKKQIGLAAESGDHYTIEQAMGVLAMIYMDIDEMDLAFGFLADKMAISRSIGDRMGFAIALCMLGKYYWYLGHYEHASPCLAFCLEEAVAVKDLRIAAIALSFEGRNLLAQQRLEEADLLLGRSVRLFRQLRTPYFACEALYFMCILRQRQNQYESAVEAAEEALAIADRLERRDMQVRLRVQLCDLETGIGRLSPDEAKNRLERLLDQYPGGREQAAVRFAAWKLEPEAAGQRADALRLNEELYRKSAKQEYLDRCRELGGPGVAAAARPMPQLAAEAARNKRIAANVLAELDRLLETEF